MKKKKTNTLPLVAATVALVVSTYSLAAVHACHDPQSMESCRAAVEQIYEAPPDSTVTIGGEDCTFASESSDDLVGYGFQQYGGEFYCIGSTTYCGVAYDCPTLGLQLVDYLTGPYGWFEVYLAGYGRCSDCPDVPGLGW